MGFADLHKLRHRTRLSDLHTIVAYGWILLGPEKRRIIGVGAYIHSDNRHDLNYIWIGTNDPPPSTGLKISW